MNTPLARAGQAAAARPAGPALSHSVPGTVDAPAPVRAPGITPDAVSGLTPFATVAGKVYMSQDAIGTNDPAGGPVRVHKRDASATVKAAYLLAAGVPGYVMKNGDITLNGTSLSFPAANNVTGNFGVNSVWTDVTSIVKPVVDSAPAGDVSFTAAEPNNTTEIDGEILAVILQDPALPTNNTVSFEFGALNTTGDNYSIGLAQPVSLSNKNLALTMSIGDSYSFQGPPATGQYSVITVNGKTLTSSAGGNDDSACKYDSPPDFASCGDGELITVGGIGDSPANPADPTATDATCAGGPPRCDDELYNLLPFVHNGDTSIKVSTVNPSNNDNIFFTGFELDSAVAVVGEGATLSPASGASPVGKPYTLTAKVQDSSGKPIAGQALTFTVLSGPDAGVHHAATTGTTGSASFSYSGKSAGQDVLQVSFTDSSGKKELSNTATVNWTTAAKAATSVATTLSGAGQSGAKISIPYGQPARDSAALSGKDAATAAGTVTYTVYSDAKCTKVAAAAGTGKVTKGKAGSSAAETLPAGTYYWRASYSGDAVNAASAAACGSEVLTVRQGAGRPGTAPFIDTLTTAWGTSSATARVSTNLSGDLVVAFVEGFGPGNKAQSSTVSGGGLTWYRISRQDPVRSDTEVWAAIPAGKLAGATVTARAGLAGYGEVISVVAFKNAAGLGPQAFASSAKGAPRATLKTTAAGTWVFAIGADWATYAKPAPAAGQLIISAVNAPGGKTVWVQATSVPTPTSGTTVTISDATPTTDPYDLLLVGIQ